jgi:type IV pilus assembly protein PilB
MIKLPSKDLLKKELIKRGYIDSKKFSALEKNAKKSKRSLEEILIEEKIISSEDLAKIKSEISGIPEAQINDFIDFSLLSFIPESVIKNSYVLPIKKQEDKLIVAMADPWDEDLIDFLRKKTGLEIEVQYASKDKILETFNKVKEWDIKSISKGETKSKEEANIGESIIKIVDSLIKEAIKSNASDIHIESQENELVVRYRIDGILHDIVNFLKEYAPAIIARIKVLANLKLDEHRLPQDGRFKLEVDKKRYSFRVSVMPVIDGEKVVIRILEEEGREFSLEELGFRKKEIEIINEAITKPYGMILSTGPTGSGKTTTLYSLLKKINKREINIVTIEDPIEYKLTGANQTQVKPEIGLTFASGLRSILRQDPNVIMVGEIRDNETAALAINAALTGHLVLSTLHTNDAAGALPRLIDMGVESFLIASTVNVIIGQRLVRKLCPKTKIPYKLSDDQYKELANLVNIEEITNTLKKFNLLNQDQTLKDITWYKPGFADDCPDGYSGRIGIYEVLEVNDDIRELIFAGANADKIKQKAREQGMITMQEDGFIKAAEGITSIEEIIRVTKE